MANVISIKMIAGRTGSTTIQPQSVTGDNVIKYRVLFDAPDATAEDAKNASYTPSEWGLIAAIPPYWSQLGLTPYRLFTKSADQVADRPEMWIVSCTFSIPQPGQKEKQPDQTKWNIKISGTGQPFELETRRDWNGKAVANKAKELFVPYQKFIFYDEALTVSYDTTDPNWEEITTYPGYVNDVEVTLTINGTTRTFPLGTMLYQNYDYSLTVTPEGNNAVSVTLHFLIRLNFMFGKPSTEDGGETWYPWKLVLDNVGLNELDSGGKLVPIVDSNNNPITVPQGLDNSGHKLALGSSLHQTCFEMFKRYDFTTLLDGIGT